MKLKGEDFTHMHFIRVDDVMMFIDFQKKIESCGADKPIIPMLRILHQYPDIMNQMQCDKGAIKHIFSGSNVMAPGLVSEGGKMPE